MSPPLLVAVEYRERLVEAKTHRYLIATIMENMSDTTMVANAVASLCEMARNGTCASLRVTASALRPVQDKSGLAAKTV